VAHLYENYQGRAITTHSYSSGVDFKTCRRKYYLKRVKGWRERGQKASLEFGKCIEAGVQFFYESNLKPESGVDEFKRRWLKFQEIELLFTDKEGSWVDLYTMGAEMLRLFEVLSPTLPIHKPVFQACYRQEVFPGTTLAGIDLVAYIDIISTLADGKRILIDVKTAANAYNLAAEFVALDPQLATYAWQSGIRDVAFMTFVKARPESFKDGDTATLLADVGDWKASASGIVFPLPAPKRAKDEPEPEPVPPEQRIISLVSEFDYDRFKEEAKGLRGKALDEKKFEFFGEFGITVVRGQATKQKVQFIQGTISEESVYEAAQRVGREVGEIERCGREGDFPREPSVRFPDTKCTWCVMRGHCTNNPSLVDKLLVQIAPAPEHDWLDDLEAE
jgi:hypothetical protein